MYTLAYKDTNPIEYFYGQLERFDKSFYTAEIEKHGLDAVINDDLAHFWNNDFYDTIDTAQKAAEIDNETIIEFTINDLRAAYQRAFVL